MGILVKAGRTNDRKRILCFVALIALMQLSACGNDKYIPEEQLSNLPCKLRGACDKTVNKYLKQLNRKGVRVIAIGQDYLISIPSTTIFEEQTPHLTWESYSLLNDVATLLKQFRKVAITVSSHTSKYVSVQREHALTLARSRVVGEYLWSQGVDSRFIFTQGLGSDKPIMRSAQGGDDSLNSRIEITFRDAVA